MQNKRTEPHEHRIYLPALWKFLLSHRRTVGFILSGATMAQPSKGITLIAGAMRFLWNASPSPLLFTRQQPDALYGSALDLSAKAIVIDSTTQAVTLEATDNDQQSD
jgi:hypothetical protein